MRSRLRHLEAGDFPRVLDVAHVDDMDESARTVGAFGATNELVAHIHVVTVTKGGMSVTLGILNE